MNVEKFTELWHEGDFEVTGTQYNGTKYTFKPDPDGWGNFCYDYDYGDGRAINNPDVTVKFDGVEFSVEIVELSIEQSWAVFRSEEDTFAIAVDGTASHGYYYCEGSPFRARLEPVTAYRVVRDG